MIIRSSGTQAANTRTTWKTTGVPESFLIDPDGNLVERFPGPFRNRAEIEDFAAPALGGGNGNP